MQTAASEPIERASAAPKEKRVKSDYLCSRITTTNEGEGAPPKNPLCRFCRRCRLVVVHFEGGEASATADTTHVFGDRREEEDRPELAPLRWMML